MSPRRQKARSKANADGSFSFPIGWVVLPVPTKWSNLAILTFHPPIYSEPHVKLLWPENRYSLLGFAHTVDQCK